MYAQVVAQAASSETSAVPQVTVPLLLFGIGVVLAGGAFLVRVGGAQWRGEYTKTADFIARIWGSRWGRAAKSVYPFAWVFVITLGLVPVSGYAAEETSGPVSDIVNVFQRFIALLFLMFVLLIFIVLFNQPRFLVPPYARRGFHGVFGDWVLTGFRKLTKRKGDPEHADTSD